ncbi:hypothetical protein ACFFRR_006005 [Megaselia abdita]
MGHYRNCARIVVLHIFLAILLSRKIESRLLRQIDTEFFSPTYQRIYKNLWTSFREDNNNNVMRRVLRNDEGFRESDPVTKLWFRRKKSQCAIEMQMENKRVGFPNCRNGTWTVCGNEKIEICALMKGYYCDPDKIKKNYYKCPDNLECCSGICTDEDPLLCRDMNKQIINKRKRPFLIDNNFPFHLGNGYDY